MNLGLGGVPLWDAEQFPLEDLRRQGLAVERDQGPLSARPLLVDGSGDLLLPRPRLTHDQHGRLRRGGQSHLVEQSPVRRTEPDQAVEPVLILEPPPGLEQLDVDPVHLVSGTLGRQSIGRTWPSRPIKVWCSSRNGQNSSRRQIRSPPAWKISVGVPGGLAGHRLGRRMEARGQIGQVSRAGGSVVLAGQSHHRSAG